MNNFDVSTLMPGQEMHIVTLFNRRIFVEYLYKAFDGEIFKALEPTLRECRIAKNEWLWDRKTIYSTTIGGKYETSI